MNNIFIQNLENAIKQKFGENAIKTPDFFWNKSKELEYKKQLIIRNRKLFRKNNKINKNGYIVRKKLFTDKSKRVCTKCYKFTFDFNDNLYLEKFDTCFLCFIKYIDGRY